MQNEYSLSQFTSPENSIGVLAHNKHIVSRNTLLTPKSNKNQFDYGMNDGNFSDSYAQ